MEKKNTDNVEENSTDNVKKETSDLIKNDDSQKLAHGVEEEVSRMVRERAPQLKQLIRGRAAPLPIPDEFRAYEEILPGAAERILVMAEKQSGHRQKMEEKMTISATGDSRLGIWLGFILGIFTISAGTTCIFLDHEISGTLLAGGGLASLVGTFIYGTRADEK